VGNVRYGAARPISRVFFISHFSSMDTLARGLLIADAILRDSDLIEMRKKRYASFD